jgi:hypothetical protein
MPKMRVELGYDCIQENYGGNVVGMSRLWFISDSLMQQGHNHTIHEDSQGRATVAQTEFDVNVALQTAEFPAHL